MFSKIRKDLELRKTKQKYVEPLKILLQVLEAG